MTKQKCAIVSIILKKTNPFRREFRLRQELPVGQEKGYIDRQADRQTDRPTDGRTDGRRTR